MLWILILLFTFLFGIATCLLVQYVILKKWYLALPTKEPPIRLQTNTFDLPKELLDCIKDPELKGKKEHCIGLNLFFQFLFRELRDTVKVRRWVLKRMQIEFHELLSTTAGKLLDQIVVRDFQLGNALPVIKEISVDAVKLKDESFIEELALLVDLEYHGGFQLAVDVDMMFGKSAYVSVKVTKLAGKARLKLSRLPYTHWSFAFIQEPTLEFDAESQLEGRPIQQLTNLIITQIRRSVRKKHTLPYFKFRYKPFFTKPQLDPPISDVHCHNRLLSVGKLSVTVVQCSRVVAQTSDSELYCTLAIDKIPWTDSVTSRRHVWVALDCLVIKHQFETIGLTMKNEFVLDRYEKMVVVDSVVQNSAAYKANIRKGDVVLSVNNVKVNDTTMAVRVMKTAPEKFKVRIEREKKLAPRTPPPQLPLEATKESILDEFQYNEDALSIKFDKNSMQGEEFVNISLKSMDSLKDSDKTTGSDSDSSQVSVGGPTETLRRRRKPEPDSVSVDPSQLTIHKPHIPILKPVASDPTLCRSRSDSTDSEAPSTQDDELDLKCTNKIPYARDPQFRDMFEFDVKEQHRFLNLCLWCKQSSKLDNKGKVVRPPRDVLLSHTSIPLMNIALECLATLQGDLLTTFPLLPLHTNNTRLKQHPELATHKGYDDNLCHGDVTLHLHHDTSALSKAERRRLLQQKREREEAEEAKVKQTAAVTKPEEALKQLNSKSAKLPEGHHRFSGIKFSGATVCDYCKKKIWLKNGLKCEVCSLVCHKKCTERCQTHTICDASGFKLKHPPELTDSPQKTPARSPSKGAEVLQAKAKAAVSQMKAAEILSTAKPSLFSRLRRGDKNADKTKVVPEVPPRPDLSLVKKPTIETGDINTSSLSRKRSNSLTDLTPTGSDSDAKPFKAEGQEGPLQKTRSSSSLDDLKDETGSDVEIERGMNLLRHYEQINARSDEQVVTRAKEMGKELFTYLPPIERREKLDAMISKMQKEIDEESENRMELEQERKSATTPRQSDRLKLQIDKSDERVQSLAILMLHYCAGLQHCMEELENEKSRPVAEVLQRQKSDHKPEADSDEDAFFESHDSDDISQSQLLSNILVVDHGQSQLPVDIVENISSQSHGLSLPLEEDSSQSNSYEVDGKLGQSANSLRLNIEDNQSEEDMQSDDNEESQSEDEDQMLAQLRDKLVQECIANRESVKHSVETALNEVSPEIMINPDIKASTEVKMNSNHDIFMENEHSAQSDEENLRGPDPESEHKNEEKSVEISC